MYIYIYIYIYTYWEHTTNPYISADWKSNMAMANSRKFTQWESDVMGVRRPM